MTVVSSCNFSKMRSQYSRLYAYKKAKTVVLYTQQKYRQAIEGRMVADTLRV